MLRKGIESAGEPCSSASDRLNTRTRYTRRPRRQRPRKPSHRRPSSTSIGLRTCTTAQSITKPDFDSARAQYDASEEQLKSARALTSEAEIALRDTSLIAPFRRRHREESRRARRVRRTWRSRIRARQNRHRKDRGGSARYGCPFRKSRPAVDVAIDAFPTRTFHARISRMSSAADTITRNFEVEVAIPNHDHLLKVGMIGSLQFANADGASRIVGPAGATFRSRASERRQIWRVRCLKLEYRRSRSPPQRRNRLCHWNRHNRTQWANPGDRIITTGANLLKDGQPVEVLQ
jgi:multidrug efflux pump subunit AcrA (membrane-fusion protein)